MADLNAALARNAATLLRRRWPDERDGNERTRELALADLLDALAEKAETVEALETALPSSDGFCLFTSPDGGCEVRSGLDGGELGTGPSLAAAVANALGAQDTPKETSP